MILSIITINLEGLKRTYESIVHQTFTDYEWIVIDGGSTDGSREFIEEHEEKYSYWCSEPDKGIFNAMNKGVLHANRQYCLFLNSGDHFYEMMHKQESKTTSMVNHMRSWIYKHILIYTNYFIRKLLGKI